MIGMDVLRQLSVPAKNGENRTFPRNRVNYYANTLTPVITGTF